MTKKKKKEDISFVLKPKMQNSFLQNKLQSLFLDWKQR